ncbi:MAG: S8 family serine peptidase [Actinomycetota bacterium]|nr:S8 family serine peptidase [Actinomycetota bacterium]
MLAFIVAGAVLGTTIASASADLIRDDEWYLALLRVPPANHLTRGAGVVVGVVDSGVRASQPDLVGSVLPGRDFAGQTDGRVDTVGHGTGVASLIVGHGHGRGHGAGVLGLAPDARVLPVRIRVGDDSSIAAGIRWAVDHRAGVVTLALGGPSDTPALRAAVTYALDRNVVVVAAVGNTSVGAVRVQYPAAYPGVVAVSAIDRHGFFAAISVRGPQVVLAAPGQQVVVADPTSPTGYGFGTGTSGAAALVSAVAALVRSRFPRLSAANVINRLIRSARDAGPRGRDPRFGFGVVDALAALTAPVHTVSANPLGRPAGPPAASPPASPAARPPDVAQPAGRRGDILPALLVGGLVTGLFVLITGFAAANLMRSRRSSAPEDQQ